MKRDLEEQKIKQWFLEARQRDEARAPSFAETLAAAGSKPQRGGWRFVGWRLASAMAGLIAIGILAFVFFKPSGTQPPGPIIVGPSAAIPPDDLRRTPPNNPSPPGAATVSTINERRANSKSSRHRLRPVRPQNDFGQAALLSFKWQSPTDFLLRTPGADVLRTVPRIGDSLIRFDTIHSAEKN